MIISESYAQSLFEAAIRDGTCAEMLECLFEGGSVMLDPPGVHALLIPKESVNDVLHRMVGEARSLLDQVDPS